MSADPTKALFADRLLWQRWSDGTQRAILRQLTRWKDEEVARHPETGDIRQAKT